jgi:hypothetical protein
MMAASPAEDHPFMIKDLAILLGLPAAVYFLTKLTGKERVAQILGGLTLAGLLAIFIPNFMAARERMEDVHNAFLTLREALAEKSPEAMKMLVSSDQEALEEAARGLDGRIRPEDLFNSMAPHPLSHEEFVSVQLAGPDRAIIHLKWQEEGSMGMLHGEQEAEVRYALEDGEWRLSLGADRIRSVAQSYADRLEAAGQRGE